MMARPNATAYSDRLMGVKPKALARKGTSMTRVVSSRMFRLCTIYAMESVRNAMVMPSGELAISQTPDSIK